jgi:hypothetical protein
MHIGRNRRGSTTASAERVPHAGSPKLTGASPCPAGQYHRPSETPARGSIRTPHTRTLLNRIGVTDPCQSGASIPRAVDGLSSSDTVCRCFPSSVGPSLGPPKEVATSLSASMVRMGRPASAVASSSLDMIRNQLADVRKHALVGRRRRASWRSPSRRSNLPRRRRNARTRGTVACRHQVPNALQYCPTHVRLALGCRAG